MWINVGFTIFDQNNDGTRRLIADVQSASCASIICREHNRPGESNKSFVPFGHLFGQDES
jgi:hypothetical protein